MRTRPYLAAALGAAALFAPAAGAAAPNTSMVVTDPSGDANFAELHGGAAPLPSQAGQDIVSLTLDTNKVSSKVGKKTVWTPTGLKITLTTSGPVSTTPGSSYGIVATHSACGGMRVQLYYDPLGANTYGDLADCGDTDPVDGTDTFSFSSAFVPKVSGNTIVIELSLKSLPKQFKAGTALSDVFAYTSSAEPVFGYQPADFSQTSDGVIDKATATKPWKVA